jgi:regulator of protease activity HflC (stomatin/prohibitin superfamily)
MYLSNSMEKTDKIFNLVLTLIIIALIVAPIGALMYYWPKYRIYRQDLKGQANLRQQEWEKKIAVEEARARNASADMDAEAQVKRATAQAEAEIVRAKGVAEANRIIADSLKGNESYLRYLWIDKISGQNQVIYIPTEAGLPILEANRL